LQNLPPIHAGQHYIQYEQVVVALQREMQTVFTIVRQFNGEACLAQTLAEIVSGLGLVFDDQYFHLTGFCVSTGASVPNLGAHCQ
jgi:hypothetical protein